MIREIANKIAGACPLCGLRAAGCREVPQGYWCQQSGLKEDVSLRIGPSPSPVKIAVQSDPDVLASLELLRVAEAEHDRLRAVWVASLSALSANRLQTSDRRTGLVIHGDLSVGRASASPVKEREINKLQAAEAAARREMERVVQPLDEARAAYQRAVEVASHRELGRASNGH